jgi:hypothetical protein
VLCTLPRALSQVKHLPGKRRGALQVGCLLAGWSIIASCTRLGAVSRPSGPVAVVTSKTRHSSVPAYNVHQLSQGRAQLASTDAVQ